jgi:hypothetical protein
LVSNAQVYGNLKESFQKVNDLWGGLILENSFRPPTRNNCSSLQEAFMRKIATTVGFVLTCLVTAFMLDASARAASFADACGIYTPADASALLQESVSEGISRTTTFPAGDSCRYTFQKNGDSYGIQVRVCESAAIKEEGIYASAADVIARQVRAHQAKNTADGKFRLIPNLGDEAFWNGTDLFALKGDILLIIKVNAFLAGSFKDMQEANSAAMDQNLKLSQQVVETVLGRISQP